MGNALQLLILRNAAAFELSASIKWFFFYIIRNVTSVLFCKSLKTSNVTHSELHYLCFLNSVRDCCHSVMKWQFFSSWILIRVIRWPSSILYSMNWTMCVSDVFRFHVIPSSWMWRASVCVCIYIVISEEFGFFCINCLSNVPMK